MPATESQATYSGSMASRTVPTLSSIPPAPTNRWGDTTALQGSPSPFIRITDIFRLGICSCRAQVFDGTAPVKGDLFQELVVGFLRLSSYAVTGDLCFFPRGCYSAQMLLCSPQ